MNHRYSNAIDDKIMHILVTDFWLQFSTRKIRHKIWKAAISAPNNNQDIGEAVWRIIHGWRPSLVFPACQISTMGSWYRAVLTQ